MRDKTCKHTQLYIVARVLRRQRAVGAREAVYEGIICPVDGTRHHLTRLAALIFQLRREHAWVIDVKREQGKLATYTLVGEGLMPDAERG